MWSFITYSELTLVYRTEKFITFIKVHLFQSFPFPWFLKHSFIVSRVG